VRPRCRILTQMTSSRAPFNTLAVRLGQLTLISVGLLLIWDAFPKVFPPGAHDVLGALPLALIAVTYLIYQFVAKPNAAELLKAVLLAAAFLLWAANQFWPNSQRATLFNDLAIAFFVLDLFLVVVGWPGGSAAPAKDYAGEMNRS
jgi:hypothetical protein